MSFQISHIKRYNISIYTSAKALCFLVSSFRYNDLDLSITNESYSNDTAEYNQYPITLHSTYLSYTG